MSSVGPELDLNTVNGLLEYVFFVALVQASNAPYFKGSMKKKGFNWLCTLISRSNVDSRDLVHPHTL